MSSLEELEKKHQITLPERYKEWFHEGGQNAEWLVGSDVDFPRLSELHEWAQDLLKEGESTFSLPEKCFVFLMHQGYQFMYFICDGSSDPEVWYYYEGDKQPKIKWKSFSEFIQNT